MSYISKTDWFIAKRNKTYVKRKSVHSTIMVYKRQNGPEELSPGRNCFFQRNRTEMGFELDIKGVLGSCFSVHVYDREM